MRDSYRDPRLSIDLSREQFDKLNRLIPWGLKKKIFSGLTDNLIIFLEKNGSSGLAALLEKFAKEELPNG